MFNLHYIWIFHFSEINKIYFYYESIWNIILGFFSSDSKVKNYLFIKT